MSQQTNFPRHMFSDCAVCGERFFVETGYGELGVCCECTRALAHEYVMAHSGEPDDRFAPPEVIEEWHACNSSKGTKIETQGVAP